MREAVPHKLWSPLFRVKHQVEPERTAVRSGSLPRQEYARGVAAFVIPLYRHAPERRLFSHLSLRSVVGRGYPLRGAPARQVLLGQLLQVVVPDLKAFPRIVIGDEDHQPYYIG